MLGQGWMTVDDSYMIWKALSLLSSLGFGNWAFFHVAIFMLAFYSPFKLFLRIKFWEIFCVIDRIGLSPFNKCEGD